MIFGRLKLSFTNGIGEPPTPAAPVNTVAPVISGSNIVGGTLTTTNGSWSGYPAPTYTYQWRNAGVDIGGATNSTYITQAGDDGDAIDCVVTATNSEGSASQDSNNITPGTVPVNTVAPVASGTGESGETLSVTNGTWTGTATITYTYQWRRDGVDISGATNNTYLLVEDDEDTDVDCVVTGTNSYGADDADSNDIAVTAPDLETGERYWVGGTDTWNGTAGSKWAYTSGGAGGAPVPTANEDVFFDANSGTGTVSSPNVAAPTTAICKNLDFTGFTGTFSFTRNGQDVDVYGSLILGAGMTLTTAISANSAPTLRASTGSHSITANGIQLPGLWINGAGLYTFTDDFICRGGCNIGAAADVSFAGRTGSFVNNFNCTTAGTRAVNITNADLTISGNYNITQPTNLTLTTTGSTVRIGGTSMNFGGIAHNNVIINQNGDTRNINGTLPTINGDFTIQAAASGGRTVNFSTTGTLAVAGAINIAGASGNVISINRTGASGQAKFSKTSGTVTLDYCTITNSDFSGGATWQATNSTDGGGNTGISFI